MEHFDFKNKRSVNPLEKVNYFFINPMMSQSAQTLGLERKVKDCKTATISFQKGMPVVLFSLDLLDLGVCVVKWQDNGGLIISKGTFGQIDIYFKWTDAADTIRIDTVLVKSSVCDRELIRIIEELTGL